MIKLCLGKREQKKITGKHGRNLILVADDVGAGVRFLCISGDISDTASNAFLFYLLCFLSSFLSYFICVGLSSIYWICFGT
ncbi:hypothetical protein BDW67DRAFT_93257 [Aspergillus spinulosporus]